MIPSTFGVRFCGTINQDMADDNKSSKASAAADQGGPFHVLMLPEGETIDSRRKVDESLRHDYLGKRYEAYKALNQGKEREDDPVWSGSKTIEKWLIWCCELPEISAVDQADFTLPGSLRRDRVLKFVGYLALYCHDIISRALAISILERTVEADLPAMQAFDAALQKQGAVTPGTNQSSRTSLTVNPDTRRDSASPTEGSSPTTRNRKRRLETKSPPTTSETDDNATTNLTTLPKKPDRLWQFLAAGGLKILDQWIEDASKPVTTAKAPPTGKATAPKESPTGALLLPLLVLLRNLPFDKKLVTQSKINRQIRKLSKEIDALVETKKTKKATHPRAGGYPIVEIQEALNELKTTWNAQQKLVTVGESPPDPFQAVQEALDQRLSEMKEYHSGKISQPAWLAKAREEPSRKEPPAKKKRTMSTEEMNRIDHERERSLRIKEDLQKAEQERRKYQERLRQIKNKHAAEQKQAQTAASQYGSSRRKVRWRDGMSHVSASKERHKLEEVFVFDKVSSAASGLVSDAASTEEDEEENPPKDSGEAKNNDHGLM